MLRLVTGCDQTLDNLKAKQLYDTFWWDTDEFAEESDSIRRALKEHFKSHNFWDDFMITVNASETLPS